MNGQKTPPPAATRGGADGERGNWKGLSARLHSSTGFSESNLRFGGAP